MGLQHCQISSWKNSTTVFQDNQNLVREWSRHRYRERHYISSTKPSTIRGCDMGTHKLLCADPACRALLRLDVEVGGQFVMIRWTAADIFPAGAPYESTQWRYRNGRRGSKSFHQAVGLIRNGRHFSSLSPASCPAMSCSQTGLIVLGRPGTAEGSDT